MVFPVTTSIWPQPLIVVRDVQASSRFYGQILGAESAHGGEEYEQLVSDGELILQLHHIEVEDHHGPLASPEVPLGNGALLWFEVSDFEAAADGRRALKPRSSATPMSTRTPSNGSSGCGIRMDTWSFWPARRSTVREVERP